MAKILLAEDDNDMRRFLVKALQNAGYDVISYDNGLSAYQRLREEPFELLLTDIVMPEMDGIELARRASELDPDIKIMFITGFAAVALNSDRRRPRTPRSSPSRCTCATSSTKCRRCWPPDRRLGRVLHETQHLTAPHDCWVSQGLDPTYILDPTYRLLIHTAVVKPLSRCQTTHAWSAVIRRRRPNGRHLCAGARR